MILNKFTKDGIQYNFSKRPTSSQFPQCRFKLIGNGTTGLSIVDSNGNVCFFILFQNN